MNFYPNSWADDRNSPERWCMPYAASEAFHRYGIWRRAETTVVFNHDGEQVAKVKTGGAFDEAMYLFFATKVFFWEGLPTIESLRVDINAVVAGTTWLSLKPATNAH